MLHARSWQILARSIGLILFGVSSLLLTAFIGGAEAADFDAEKLKQVRQKLQAQIDAQQISGAVTLVGTSQGIVSHEAIGLLDLETKAAMPKDAMFRIASMTKPITALGIMILVDEGKLSPDDPVETHLPEFKGQMLVASRTDDTITLKKPSRPIQLRDLLTHTGGLPQYPVGLGNFYMQRDRTLAEATLVISQCPLDFEPGSKWKYSNQGIDTLGRIIEVASGIGYEEFLAKRIFRPLAMTETTFRPNAAQLARWATLYKRKNDRLEAAPPTLIGPFTNFKHPVPAGGLWSTGGDLAKICQMMLHKGELDGKRVLSEKAVAAMTSLQTGDLACGFTPGMGFGFGWAYVNQPQGITEMLSRGTFGHGGAFGTQYWVDPVKDVFEILLIQRSDLANGDASDIRRDFQTAVFDAVK